MGILTKRIYLADGVSYLETLRLFGTKYGQYSLLMNIEALPEADQPKLKALGVEDMEKVKYIKFYGFKHLYGNDDYSVDFYDKDMKLWATAVRSGMIVKVKYYVPNLYNEEMVSKLTRMEIKHGGSMVFIVTQFTNLCAIGYKQIVKLVKRMKTVYPKIKNPDDHDIVAIERQMHYDVGNPENTRPYDVVTIKQANGFIQELWVNAHSDRILIIENKSPDRDRSIIWILKKESELIYGIRLDDDFEKKFSNELFCTVDTGHDRSYLHVEDRTYEFDTKDMRILYDELESGEFPEHFVADIIDEGKDVSI